MFERFTDRVRKVMVLASHEAQRLNHEYVGPEHVLLGLVKEGSGVGENVLENLGADPREVRKRVEDRVTVGATAGSVGKLPQTPQTKKVIARAIAEARAMDHHHVGTEHLLLGLLQAPDDVPAAVLKDLNLELEGCRAEVLTLLGGAATDPRHTPPADALANLRPLTPEAVGILTSADEAAQGLSHDALRPGHLLLALLGREDGIVAAALGQLGINPTDIRDQVLEILDSP